DLVVIPPGTRLIERFAFRLAVADDACRPEVEDMRMVGVDVDHADPFVGVPLADLGPGQWLRDRWCDLFGNIHVSHPRRVALAVKFLATRFEDRRCQLRDQRSLATAFAPRLKATGS